MTQIFSFLLLSAQNFDSFITDPTEALPEYGGSLLKIGLTFIGLMIALFISVWALKKLHHQRFSFGGSHKSIKVIESRPLSPKTMLHLVELGGKKVFISESQAEIKRLSFFNDLKDSGS